MSTYCCLVYCACPDLETADRLANLLVDHKLAACVSILPGIRSVYDWQGQRCVSPEVLLLIKTTQERLPSLQESLAASHPYELPEIIAVPVDQGWPAYLDWVRSATAPP